NYSGSTGTAAVQVVTGRPTSVSLASSLNPSTYGQSVAFTATVTGASPTGTVTFVDGSTTLGTPSISNGVATFSTSSLTGGSHSIAAVYSGDTNNATSTSPTLGQAVNTVATTTALTSSLNPANYGQAVTFTATVSGSTPGGTITFKDGATALGVANLSGGSASYVASSLTGGSHNVTALYSGDTNNATSTSPAVTQTVNAAAKTTTLE